MNHRGELGDPTFCWECFALSDVYIQKYFGQTLLEPKISLEQFSGKLSYKILADTVLDREFQGLFKSLFRFDLAIHLRWQISKIKECLIILSYLVMTFRWFNEDSSWLFLL